MKEMNIEPRSDALKFLVVSDEYKKYPKHNTTIPSLRNNYFSSRIYEISSPISVNINPNENFKIWTDIKIVPGSSDIAKIKLNKNLYSLGLRLIYGSEIWWEAQDNDNSNTGGNFYMDVFNPTSNIITINAGDKIGDIHAHTYYPAY